MTLVAYIFSYRLDPLFKLTPPIYKSVNYLGLLIIDLTTFSYDLISAFLLSVKVLYGYGRSSSEELRRLILLINELLFEP